MEYSSAVEVGECRGDLENPFLEKFVVGIEGCLLQTAALKMFHLDTEDLLAFGVVTGVVLDNVGVAAQAEYGVFVECERVTERSAEWDLRVKRVVLF